MKKLIELLSINQLYDAQYRNGLSNHMPMSLIALHRLQVDDLRLVDFFENNCNKLEPMPNSLGCKISDNNLLEYLGKQAFYSDLTIFFRAKLAELGYHQLLEKYLATLSRGIAAGAFHGLLRVAYGLIIREENHEIGDEEIVCGLAYWADTYLPIEYRSNEEQSDTNLAEILGSFDYAILQRIRANLVGSGLHQHLIYEQLAFVAEQPCFDVFAKKVRYTDKNLNDLADFTLNLYCATHDFTALHTVTSAHAFRCMLPFFINKDDSFNNFWRAIFASYLTIGAPVIGSGCVSNAANSSQIQWQHIIDEARFSRDDHVVKFVFTCLEQFNHYDNPLYITAAAIKSGLYTIAVNQ